MKEFRKLHSSIRFAIGVIAIICGVRCVVNATGDYAYFKGLHDAVNGTELSEV